MRRIFSVKQMLSFQVEKHVNRLKSLMQIIVCWFSVDCMQGEDCIRAFVLVCQRFWPTIGVDADLQSIFMKMLLFVTEKSLPGKMN